MAGSVKAEHTQALCTSSSPPSCVRNRTDYLPFNSLYINFKNMHQSSTMEPSRIVVNFGQDLVTGKGTGRRSQGAGDVPFLEPGAGYMGVHFIKIQQAVSF